MKKFIASLMLVLMFSLFMPSGALAGPAVDQQNDNVAGAAASLLMNAPYYRAQTFRPALQHLTQIDLYFKDRVNGSWVDVYVLNELTQVEVAHSGNRMSAGDGWEDYAFDVDLVKEARYRIKVVVPSATGVKWPFTDSNNYARGMQYYEPDNDNASADFLFRTYGTDPVEIIEEQTNPGSDQTPEQTGEATTTAATTTTPAGEAPSTATSSSIAKPTELTANYTDSLKLTWKASATAGIDGYMIFRSETKGKSYTKIGTTDKNTVEYVDATAQASKTYYYVVRANKGSAQSASSNEASASVPESAAPIAPQNLKVTHVTESSIKVVWDKNPEANISGYTATIYLEGKEVETKIIAADENGCLFKNLISDAEYKITVTANNSLGKSSAISEIMQSTKAPYVAPAKEPIFSLTLWILFAAASALTILLIVLFFIRHKKKKLDSSAIRGK